MIRSHDLYFINLIMCTCRLLQNSPEHWLQSNWHEKHMTFHRVSTFISLNAFDTTED